jgi:hypothetical protein
MNYKLGICIPYRNRKEHLEQLIPRLSKHLLERNIEHKFYVGHQVDDELFNRGAMKNIAAHTAFNDGCDYIAWHDVDMIPFEECDYSYPTDNPIHIATKLSKYNYGLGYDQYFGGVVLFNKEQVEKTNGYSNEYWDWGQEDDDLFWRCYFEGYTTGDSLSEFQNRKVAYFNGQNSFLTLPTNREISSCLHNDFTLSVLFKAEQQPEKVPIWLVGDTDRKFIEYPLIRKSGSWTWGLSFNNSRAVTMTMFDKNTQYHYNWGKRFENLWTWVTLSYSRDSGLSYFYVNKELVSQIDGIKCNKPFPIPGGVKTHDSIRPFILGFCPHLNTFYKGQIAEVKLSNQFSNDIENVWEHNENLVLHYDFDKSDRNLITNDSLENMNVEFQGENLKLIDNILPYRVEGRFECLPHVDEGFVMGKWAKGETTARNERRFVTEMQQRKINYKDEGMNKILDVLEIQSINKDSYENTTIINVKMK